MKEVVKESGAKRKKSLPRKRSTVKRQKLEEKTSRRKTFQRSIEDEEVSLVDGVLEGALGALALEMEALVDAMDVDNG
ncbi:hypothetical protein Tco_1103529 [Tanacetum coccineum]